MPDSRLAYSPSPHSFSALPSLPATRAPVAVQFESPAAAEPSAIGSVTAPSAPTGTSVSTTRLGCAAAPVMPLQRSCSTVACTVLPKTAGSMCLTTTFFGPGGPPPTMTRACRFEVSSVARPWNVLSVVPCPGVTCTVSPVIREYQL